MPTGVYERPSLRGRFFSKVHKTGTCWLWTGATNGMYGQIWDGARGRTVLTHIVSYEIHRGPIPEGQLVLHVCDLGICVNPEHLFLGTYTDNLNDSYSKDRVRVRLRGEANGLASTTNAIAARVRELRAAGLSYHEISTECHVSYKVAWRIVNDPKAYSSK